MKTAIRIFGAAILLFVMSSCRHKALYIEEPATTMDIEVVFDWRNAPDANPASMALHLYDHDTGKHLRFIFTGREGGTIRLPFATYDALCMNSDNTDWALSRSNDDIESFEIYTDDVNQLEAYSLRPSALPRAAGTEHQRMAKTPGMLWADRNDGFKISSTAKKQVITLYPQEAVCHYVVDVIDLEGGASLDNVSVDATLSGVAEGYRDGQEAPAEERVTMPFVLSLSADKKSLHSEFLTFGQTSDSENHENLLTIYFYLADGSKRYYTFDVTKQIDSAPDPHHVHIIVRGLTLPERIVSGGGLKPDVNDWISEFYDLEM